jgi:ACS family hexuronate transporter-like MFS transporter
MFSEVKDGVSGYIEQVHFNNDSGSNYRWKICALLFFATTINYVDRSVLSILAPKLQHIFGWSEIDYSYIVDAFELAYGVSVIGMGKLVDKYGARIIFSVAVFLWSLASMGHAFVRSVIGFALARFGLGVGEAANFPSALRAVSEWFPEKERATAAGIFNAGSSIGAIVAPVIVPWLTLNYGWEWCFIVTGLLGLIWLICWLLMYRKPENHPHISSEELRYIQSGNNSNGTHQIPWRSVAKRKETIVICLVRFISDPTWWFLLFWLPKFLNHNYGITLATIGPPMITIYLIADIGSVSWGWFSSFLVKKNWNVNHARKLTMLICALCVIPIITVSQMNNIYIAIGLISLAAASHMGFVANVYTIISDVYPQKAVGSVTGLSTMSAVVGGLVFTTAIGFILQVTGSYFLIFMIAGFTYFIAWIVLMIGIPHIQSIEI